MVNSENTKVSLKIIIISLAESHWLSLHNKVVQFMKRLQIASGSAKMVSIIRNMVYMTFWMKPFQSTVSILFTLIRFVLPAVPVGVPAVITISSPGLIPFSLAICFALCIN